MCNDVFAYKPATACILHLWLIWAGLISMAILQILYPSYIGLIQRTQEFFFKSLTENLTGKDLISLTPNAHQNWSDRFPSAEAQ